MLTATQARKLSNPVSADMSAEIFNAIQCQAEKHYKHASISYYVDSDYDRQMTGIIEMLEGLGFTCSISKETWLWVFDMGLRRLDIEW